MATVTDIDPYEVLGVARFSSVESCRGAYRRLVMRLHPDTGGSTADQARFRLVTEAWGIVTDPDLKARADEALRGAPQGRPTANARARWSAGQSDVVRARARWWDAPRGTQVDSVDRVHNLAGTLYTFGLIDHATLAEVVDRIVATPETTMPFLAEAMAVAVQHALALDEDADRLTSASAAVHAARRAASALPDDGSSADIRGVTTAMTLSGVLASRAEQLTRDWAPVASLLPPWLRTRWLANQAHAAQRGRRW